MSSRFIDEEDVEVRVGDGFEEKLGNVESAFNKNEPTLEKEGQENNDKKEIVNEEKNNHFRKRKSLQVQLQNNRVYKYRERKRKMDKQNSSFKMRKDTRQFYGMLSAEKEKRKKEEKDIFDRELAEFRQQKLKKEKQKKINEDETKKELRLDQEENQEQQSNLKPGLVAYSDSD